MILGVATVCIREFLELEKSLLKCCLLFIVHTMSSGVQVRCKHTHGFTTHENTSGSSAAHGARTWVCWRHPSVFGVF